MVQDRSLLETLLLRIDIKPVAIQGGDTAKQDTLKHGVYVFPKCRHLYNNNDIYNPNSAGLLPF